MPAPNGTASAVSSRSLSVTIATAPHPNAIRIPGTKWCTCRPPTRTLPNGHHPRRIPYVDSRISANESTNPVSRLNSAVSRRGADS